MSKEMFILILFLSISIFEVLMGVLYWRKYINQLRIMKYKMTYIYRLLDSLLFRYDTKAAEIHKKYCDEIENFKSERELAEAVNACILEISYPESQSAQVPEVGV